MFRTVSVLLTVFGLLICPYVCLGKTGGLCANTTDSVGCCDVAPCCSSEKSALSQVGHEIPAPCENCDHECVIAKGTIETSQKTPREIAQLIFDAGIIDLVLPMQPSASIPVETTLREDVSTNRPHSGWQLRVILASFLL